MNVFNLSFGKDSMATLILAAEQGIPIDRVMYCDIRFNNEISGEHPLMAKLIPTAEKRLKKLFGVTVDHIHEGRIQIKGDISQIMNLYGCLCVVKNNHVKNFFGNGFHKVEVIGNIYDNPELLEGNG